MGLAYVDVTAEHIPALRQLLLRYWERNWTSDVADRFLHWRILERPEWAAVAAFDGDDCVALIDSFIRPYTLGGRRVRVRETCDWICLPDYRPFVGLRVLQSMMKQPEPIITTTSSEANNTLLTGLKWRTIGDLQQCVFPIGAGAIVKSAAQRMNKELGAVPAFTGRLLPFRFRKPGRLPAPEQPASVIEIRSSEEWPDIAPPHDVFSLCALADERDVAWLRDAPDGEGEFLWLQFRIGDQPVGLSLSRLYQEGPYRGAKLLHLQASRHDHETYAWLASTTSQQLAERGAHWIDARFSSETVLGALEDVGFMRMSSWPVYWWSSDRSDVDGDILASGMRGVEGLMPYPYLSETVLHAA